MRKRSLSIFLLAMINVAAICSIRNWPMTAEYGITSIAYYLIAAFIFLIPVALVSAELATGWPERGGVFVWVKEALGHRAGFLSVWLLWIENVVWYPTILSFVAASIAYSFNPSLANNPIYLFSATVVIFWALTLVNMFGMKISGWFSTLCVFLGTIIPGVIIIFLGGLWYFTGDKSYLEISASKLLPDFSNLDQMTFLLGVILGFAGMEMSAVHAKEVKHPQRNFPRAILLSTIIILTLSIFGSLAISVVLPAGQISLHSGGIEAIAVFLKAYKLGWAIPLLSILVTIGALGGISTWIAGPSKGLLAAAQDGDFPPLLHKVNKQNMPVALLVSQAIIIMGVSSLFFFMPSINSSYFLLIVLAAQLYIIMYIIMFVSAIILRYKRPHTPRSYKIPLKNFGMWIVSGIGIVGGLFCFVLGFFPPSQIDTGDTLFYVLFLAIGIIVACAIPYIILLFKKPSWNELIPFEEEVDID